MERKLRGQDANRIMQVSRLVPAEKLIRGVRGKLDFGLDTFVTDETYRPVDIFKNEIGYRGQNHIDQKDRLQADLCILLVVE